MSKSVTHKQSLEDVLREREDQQLCVESYPHDEDAKIGFEFHIFFDITRDERSGFINNIEFSHARIIDGREESMAILTFGSDTEQEFVDRAWAQVRGA